MSILSTDKATHLRNRRTLTGAFTEHAIAEHASFLESLVGLMIQRFKEATDKAHGSAVLNLVDWLNWLTFDISGALWCRESFDSIRSGHTHPWVEISCNFGKGIALMTSISFSYPLNEALTFAVPKKSHGEDEKFLQRLSMQHKPKAQDHVGSIMAYNGEKGEVKIPKEEIEANITLLIFAGSETISSAMSAILSELLRRPAALRKAVEEVRSAFRSIEDITVAFVAKLEYLTAIIQEGIRMGRAAAIAVARVVPKEYATILGQLVPGG